MSLNTLGWPLTALICLALSARAGCQTPPAMEKDPVGYLHYLETATDPQAVALRQQIQNGPADLARAREAAVKEGIPLDIAGLQKPLPPEGRDAALAYQELAQRLQENPLFLPPYAQPLRASYAYTPAQLAAVRTIYDTQPDIWNLAHDAADKPQCVFVRDWKLGPALLFPEYATLREAERLIATETYLLAAQGRYSEAVKNQAPGFRIAEHAGSDPTLISYLVGEACGAIALRGMQDILTLAGPNAALDAQVQKAVADNRPRLSLRYALGGEVATLQEGSIAQLKTDVTQSGASALIKAFLPKDAPRLNSLAGTTPADDQLVRDGLDASLAVILSRELPLVSAADLPPAQRRPIFAQYAKAQADRPRTPLTLFADALTPTLDTLDQIDTQLQAQEAVTQAAAAVLAAGTLDGVFPAALPQPLADPFTGHPLGYQREGAIGFVVYSAGPDGAFEGGKPGEKAPVNQVLFRYPTHAVLVPPDMLK